MDFQAMLAIAFSGQLLTETSPIQLAEAHTWVKAEVQKYVTDADLIKKVPLRLLKLKQLGKLNRECLASITQNIIQEHFMAPSCKCLPLPETIVSDRYANVSPSGLLRVFNLLHADQQGDGWSCGFRAVFSAAALHKVLTSGSRVLSHEDIGRICRDFRERVPGLNHSIDYIALRSKLDAVITLVRKDQKDIDEALKMLGKDTPDCMKVLLQLQPDYFILKAACQFLQEHSPPVLDAVALLGKATGVEAKALSAELVQLLVNQLQQDSSRLRHFTEVTDRIFSLAKSLVDQSSDFDLKRFVSWSEKSDVHKAEMVALALKSGHVGVRRQVEALCATNRQLKSLFDELAAVLYGLDLQGLDLGAMRARLDTLTKPSLQRVLHNLCVLDSRLTSTCTMVRESSLCPKLRSAIALFNTPEPFNDEIIALLRASKHPSIGSALLCIDEAEHSKIQGCIRALKALLYKYRRDNVDQIIADLRQVKDDQVKRAIELLGGKRGKGEGEDTELDKTLHDAKQLLEEVDRQKLVRALKILEPTCIFEQTHSDVRAIQKLIEELRLVKDPSIAQAIHVLKYAHTHSDALKAVSMIERGDVVAQKDARALLQSDHTAGAAWRVQDDCVLAAECIRSLQASIAAEGELATAEHLIRLAGMPALGLPHENVHILGDFLGRGLLFDFSDAILDSGISDAERTALEKCKSREQQSALVEDAIKKHLQENYLEKASVNGAHYFICNIKRPSEHWIVAATVKFAHKKPILVILDSMNYPIQSDTISNGVGTDAVVAFLFNKFIRPFN